MRKNRKPLTLEQIYPDGFPKKREIRQWDFPIMDFGDDENEDSIQKSQDFQGSGKRPKARRKARKRNA